ncbi:MAG TPA: DUF1330 domain-containing protein [Stellaceae bacterium]|jgi:uncharacterized protein (DUF1330 family)|nr:DUF1330 domain-containing protein [Stellaceae bacterium]
MKQSALLVLTLVAGIAIGAWGIPSLHAQPGAQGAYVVMETHVTDPAGFTEYVRHEPAALGAYHGSILARALPDVHEGTPPDGVVTLLGFPTAQAANQWFNSPEQASLAALREKAATSRVYIISGTH